MSSYRAAQRNTLSFGIEMELFVRPKPNVMRQLKNANYRTEVTPESPGGADTEEKELNRRAIRRTIAQNLVNVGVPAGLSSEGYKAWTVTDESVLDEFQHFWRVELVSKTFKTTDLWQDEVALVFRTIESSWDIRLTIGCSMHIHVSPGIDIASAYTTDEVVQVLKGTAYFDKAITKVIPSDRKANGWAMSAFAPPPCASRGSQTRLADLKEAYDQVPTNGWQVLFRRFDKVKMKPMVHLDLMRGERHLSWNFYHLAVQCGTIEFRRPPGVRSAKDAIKWTGLTLGFVRQCLATDWAQCTSRRTHPTVEEFSAFVVKGIMTLGPNSSASIKEEDIREDKTPARVYTRDEMRIIEEKKAKKEGKVSPYAVKASSRPSTPV